uniref:Uncharacterized protein n=1 Tax=Cyanothece sp. (strain PCC 7425 / ATCC 29141) TaxID=395961 RepID=B8HWN2_CYAP4
MYDGTDISKTQDPSFAENKPKANLVLGSSVLRVSVHDSTGRIISDSLQSVATDRRNEDPTYQMLLETIVTDLQEQEGLGSVKGLTINEIRDLKGGLGYSAIRDRLLLMVANGKIACIPGSGRRPSYYCLPHQLESLQSEYQISSEELDSKDHSSLSLSDEEVARQRALDKIDGLKTGLLNRMSDLMVQVKQIERQLEELDLDKKILCSYENVLDKYL